MKREIKFRAWNKLNGSFIKEPFMIDLEGYFYPQDSSGNYNFNIDCNQVELMQFTGLHDKNGKEIFESDKVKYYQPYSKKWEEGFVLWDDCWACFGIYKRIGDEYCHESDWVKIQEIEVIGNIHENTELLK